LGDLLAQVVGEEFDVVGFDPRGVARSTPKVTFFEGQGLGAGEREVWADYLSVIRSGSDDELDGESGRSLEKTWARAVVMNKLVSERAGDWLGNINTEQTAYDMLSIVKAYGREKIQYWGFSYGTILGSTFAALFPVCQAYLLTLTTYLELH
jgi:pimeloyl-ACP methyl ester carboxylesterase